MSIENREGPRIVSTLAQRVGQGADSTHIADAIAQIWSEAEIALIPIVGREGVAALLRRSVFLATSAYPWFSDTRKNDTRAINFEALKLIIENQTAEEAKAGGTALFMQFYGLLTNLIGPSLADRILESAWVDSSRGATAQDHSL